MKSKKLIVVLIILAVAVAIGISIKRYWIREAATATEAVWHDNECFIFVSSYAVGWSGTLFEEVLIPIGEKLDMVRDTPEPLGGALTLYHYIDGRLETYEFKDQYLGGQFVVFNGVLHFLEFDEDDSFASGWRWTGSDIAALTEAEVREVEKVLPKDDEDPIKKAGWSGAKIAIYSGESQKSYPLNLRGGELTLTVKNEQGRGSFSELGIPSKTTIALSAPGSDQQQLLRTINYEWDRVDEASYQKRAGARTRNQTLFGRRTVFIGLSGLIVYLVHVIASVFGMKGKVVRAVPISFQFVPTTPDQFPQLDVDALRRYTEALEAMGFVKLRDYTLADDSVKLAPAFGRLFANADRQCLAEVSQLFPQGKKPIQMGCVIVSLMEDGWSLSTTDRKPQGISYMMRRPRALWTNHPGISPSELLHIHLDRRRQITYELGVKVVADTSAEAFFARARTDAVERQQSIKRRNLAVALSETALFKVKPKYEWMGEYPQAAARRKEPWKYVGKA